MAVYTVLERDELEAFIKPFGLGPLLDAQAVADGVENTTYFIDIDNSDPVNEGSTAPVLHFVLTVFEEITFDELPFYVSITTTLHDAGLPVPCPLRDYNGTAIQQIQGKPALLFPRVEGRHPKQANAEKCRVIGDTLARMHEAGRALHESRKTHIFEGCRSPRWVLDAVPQVIDMVSAEDAALMREEAARLAQLLPQLATLPQGIIHNDLFRDNTLFVANRNGKDEHLGGIIDFYNAAQGPLLMDIAIAVNDWCSRDDARLDPALTAALLDAYAAVRPFTPAEVTLWPDVIRAAALRFWVSRLVSARAAAQTGGLVARKNPAEYRAILVARRIACPALDARR